MISQDKKPNVNIVSKKKNYGVLTWFFFTKKQIVSTRASYLKFLWCYKNTSSTIYPTLKQIFMPEEKWLRNTTINY